MEIQNQRSVRGSKSFHFLYPQIIIIANQNETISDDSEFMHVGEETREVIAIIIHHSDCMCPLNFTNYSLL